jgi:hypothetical protein
MDNGDLVLSEPGGDWMRTIEELQKDNGPVDAWSDESIPIPDEVQ